MDENCSSDEEIFSIEDKEVQCDDEEAIDPFIRTMELTKENANEFDIKLSKALAKVKVIIIYVSEHYMGFLAPYLTYLTSLTEGTKSFQCNKCTKVCKSKGGLTRHRRSKHPDGDEATSTKVTSKVHIPTVDLALLETFFKEIVEKLR
jgi:hypothetical protein